VSPLILGRRLDRNASILDAACAACPRLPAGGSTPQNVKCTMPSRGKLPTSTKPPHSGRPSPEEIERIQRRMRFETWSVLTIIIALVLAAIAVAAFPVERVLPVFIVALVVVFVASISWVVGYVRTERAFARIQTEPSPRQPLWKYVAPLGAGLLTGVMYVLFPQYGRWIWSAFFVAGVLAFIWVLVRRRGPPA
jgi:hypothetical protein